LADVRQFEHVLSLISATDHPISIKFGFQERSHDKISTFCKFKMAAVLKMALSQRDHPSSMKFGVQTLIFIPSMVTLQILQIQRADGRQLEDFLAISPKIIV